MRYRTKLLFGLIALVIFSVGLVTSLTYFHARDMVFEQIRATVLSVATSAAVAVDADAHEQIREPGEESSEAYHRIETLLRKIRDEQRETGVSVGFIYTMRQVPGEKEAWTFVVDAEEAGDDKSRIGDPVEYEAVGGDVQPLSASLEKATVDRVFIRDEFGFWLSAQAPIRNAAGEAVGLLGVDLQASRVIAKLDRLLVKAVIALVATAVAGIGVALLLARAATRPLDRVKEGVQRIASGEFDTRIPVTSNDEFGSLADSVNHMAEALQEREMLKEAFARYVSREMEDKILSSPVAASGKGKPRKITVLFSDIRGFAEWSESLQPEELAAQLNEYFSEMVQVVFRNKGTLDKFMGDGLLAIFGAPVDDDEQEKHATTALLEMNEAVNVLDAKWAALGKKTFRVGMGLHTGAALLENIGDAQRMDYSAVGRTVNTAARLAAQTEAFHTHALISSATAEAICDLFPFEEMETVDVRGASEPIAVFTLPELRRRKE